MKFMLLCYDDEQAWANVSKTAQKAAMQEAVQITHDLKRLNKKYGLVTACVGGGQGIAGIIENIN